MAKKITKREVLTACAKLWSELAQSGAKEKPRWSDKYACQCPCCEYSDQHSREYCGKTCIMSGAWGRAGCEVWGSPWVKWNLAGRIEDRKKHAKIIADYAKMLLRKMEKK